jgi:hypothetical protein
MRGLAVATMMLTANFMGSLTSYVIGVVQVGAYMLSFHHTSFVYLLGSRFARHRMIAHMLSVSLRTRLCHCTYVISIAVLFIF